MADLTTATAAYTEDSVVAAAEARSEPDWLVARRREGARAFSERHEYSS